MNLPASMDSMWLGGQRKLIDIQSTGATTHSFYPRWCQIKRPLDNAKPTALTAHGGVWIVGCFALFFRFGFAPLEVPRPNPPDFLMNTPNLITIQEGRDFGRSLPRYSACNKHSTTSLTGEFRPQGLLIVWIQYLWRILEGCGLWCFTPVFSSGFDPLEVPWLEPSLFLAETFTPLVLQIIINSCPRSPSSPLSWAVATCYPAYVTKWAASWRESNFPDYYSKNWITPLEKQPLIRRSDCSVPSESSQNTLFFHTGTMGDRGLLPGLCDKSRDSRYNPNPPFAVLCRFYGRVS